MPRRTRSSRFQGVYFRESQDPTRRHNGRPDKCYEYSYKIGGKRIWVRVGWASEGYSEQKAANLRREVLDKISAGENLESKPAVQVTLDTLATHYFDWLATEGKYVAQEKLRYDAHIRKQVGEVPLDMLSRKDCPLMGKLKKKLLEKMAPASAKRIFDTCRAMVNRGIRRGLWDGINPFGKERFEMPAVDNKGERFLTKKEAADLLNELGKRSPQLRDMAWLSLATGMRSTEIFQLTGADIDVENTTIWINGKGRVRTPLVVDTEVIKLLLSYQTGPSNFIFQARGGGRIHGISDSFDRACVEVGLMPPHDKRKNFDTRKKVWFHTLRHTFASWIAQSGKVTLHELRDIMRHKSIDMTERYAHLIPGAVQKKAQVARDILRNTLEEAGELGVAVEPKQK